MSDPLEQAMEQIDDILPEQMDEAQIQTLFHMIAKVYGVKGRRLEKFFLRLSKTCRRVEKNLEAERQRLARGETE